jgi:hypothetical protein
MEQFWRELQFNPVAPVEVPFKAELFHSPPKRIRILRRLAGKGRKRLERSIRKQNGRPKVVLGIPNDAQNVDPLLALAHGPGLVQTVPETGVSLWKKGKKGGRRTVVGGRSNLDVVDNTTTTNLSENQEQTTRKAKNPQIAPPIDTSSQPSHTTEQTTQVHAVRHSEEVPSEDQK